MINDNTALSNPANSTVQALNSLLDSFFSKITSEQWDRLSLADPDIFTVELLLGFVKDTLQLCQVSQGVPLRSSQNYPVHEDSSVHTTTSKTVINNNTALSNPDDSTVQALNFLLDNLNITSEQWDRLLLGYPDSFTAELLLDFVLDTLQLCEVSQGVACEPPKSNSDFEKWLSKLIQAVLSKLGKLSEFPPSPSLQKHLLARILTEIQDMHLHLGPEVQKYFDSIANAIFTDISEKLIITGDEHSMDLLELDDLILNSVTTSVFQEHLLAVTDIVQLELYQKKETHRFSVENCVKELLLEVVKHAGVVISTKSSDAISTRLTVKVWAELRAEYNKIPLEKFKKLSKQIFKSLCKRWTHAVVILTSLYLNHPKHYEDIVETFKRKLCVARDENNICDSTMAMLKENENSIVVTPDQILPPIDKYFEKLSDFEWRFIQNGTCNTNIQGILADMISEIIQTASASILKIALPNIQDRIVKECPALLDEGKIRPSLGDSISAGFASALNVPKQRCKCAEKLTRMVEEEISEKISSIVALLAQCPDIPEDPTVYVSGTFSNIKKLHCMVRHAASCLKRLVGKLRFLCPTSGSDTSSFDSDTDQMDANISVQTPIAEISLNLSRSWSFNEEMIEDENSDQEGEEIELPEGSGLTKEGEINPTAETESIQARTPVEGAVADIVSEILGEMDSSSVEPFEKYSSDKPASDSGLFHLGDFFSRCMPSTSSTGLKARKHHFSMFAKRQFETMKKELKQTIKTNRKYFVCLNNLCKYPKYETVSSDESIVFILPGSVPETPRPQSANSDRAPSRNTVPLCYLSSSSVDFDTIRSDVNQLYDTLTKKEEVPIFEKTLENIKNSGEITTFSRELTAKMFDLVMMSRVHQIPVALSGRSLSDTVISRTPQTVDGSKRPFSPEVLYVLIEDAVEKFLLKLLLWMEKRENDRMIETERKRSLASVKPPIPKPKSVSPEKHSLASIDSPPTAKPKSVSPEKHFLASIYSPSTAKPKSVSPEKHSLASSEKPPIAKPKSVSPEKHFLASIYSPSTAKPKSVSPEKHSLASSEKPPIAKPKSVSPEKHFLASIYSPSTAKPKSVSPEKHSLASIYSPPTAKPKSVSPEKHSLASIDSPPKAKPKSVSPEKHSLASIYSPPTAKPKSVSPEKHSLASIDSPPKAKPKSVSPEKHFLASIYSPPTAKPKSVSPEKHFLASIYSPPTAKPKSVSPEKHSLASTDSPPTAKPKSVSPEKHSLASIDSPPKAKPKSVSPEKHFLASIYSPPTAKPKSVSPEKHSLASTDSPPTAKPKSVSPEKHSLASTDSPPTAKPKSVSPEKHSLASIDSPPKAKPKSVSPEKHFLASIYSPPTAKPKSVSPEKHSLASTDSPPTAKPKSVSPEKHSLASTDSPPTAKPKSVSPEKHSLASTDSPPTAKPKSVSPEKHSLASIDSPPKAKPKSVSPEKHSLASTDSPPTAKPKSVSPEKHSLASIDSPPKPKPKSVSPEKHSLASTDSPPTAKPKSVSPEKCSLASTDSPPTARPKSVSPEKCSLASTDSPPTAKPKSVSPEKHSLASIDSPPTAKPKSVSPEKHSLASIDSPPKAKPKSVSPEKHSLASTDSPPTAKPKSVSPEKHSLASIDSPPKAKPKSVSPEKHFLASIYSPPTAKPKSVSPEKHSLASTDSPPTAKPKSVSPEKHSLASTDSPPTAKPKSVSPEKRSLASSETPPKAKPKSVSPEKRSLASSEKPPTAKPKSVSPEKRSLASTNSPPTAKPKSVSPEKHSLASSEKPPIAKPKSVSPEKRSLASSETPPIAKPKSVSPEKCSASISGSLIDSSEILEMGAVSGSSSDVKKMSTDLSFSLFKRLLLKCKSKTMQSMAKTASTSKEIHTLINHLIELIQSELSSTESATSLINDKNQFIKKMAKSLIKEFGSPENVLNAAMLNDSSFDNAVISHLKIGLGVIPSPPKKSKISRFFSAVLKAFVKPFRCCFKGSND
ncbi:unnamed protein product [Oreochromis niloticus]|nr:unnamed protein product [Mustela putorius furo]